MAFKGYLYRYEGGKYVPYEVMSREEVLVGKSDVDYLRTGGKKWVIRLAGVCEEAGKSDYELRGMGFYSSIGELVANELAEKAFEEIEKQRRAGMLSGNQIAKFNVCRDEFIKLGDELFNKFKDFILNPDFEEVVFGKKANNGKVNRDNDET